MMTTNLKVSSLTNLQLDFVTEIELKDKLYFDEDLQRKVVRFYRWDKKDFLKTLKKNTVRGLVALETCEETQTQNILGFVVFDFNEKKRFIEILNLVGTNEEVVDFLIKTLINKARFAKKPLDISWHLRYDEARNLNCLKRITENEKVKPSIIENYFEDGGEAIFYKFVFSK